jgi:hypothetical protein
MTSAFTGETAWQRLRSIIEFATFDYVGFLKPAQVITAEIRRGIYIYTFIHLLGLAPAG